MKKKFFKKTLLSTAAALTTLSTAAFVVPNSNTQSSIKTVKVLNSGNSITNVTKNNISEANLVEKLKKLRAKYNENTDWKNLSLQEKKELLKTQSEMQKFLGYSFKNFSNNSKQIEARAWTEWWGANLWVNLTKEETTWWISSLKRNYYGGSGAKEFFDNLSDVAGSTETGNEKIDTFLKYLDLLGKVGSFFSDYFDWSHLTDLANQGGGVISYRFTLAVLPSGVFPGYKVV